VRRFLFDTSVFVYALGGEHPYRDSCRAIMGMGVEGRLAGEASIELLHEFVHVRARRTAMRAMAVADARNIAATSRLHAVGRADIERALGLWAEHQRLDVRDAIFAAQALNRGIDAILSADRDFDGIDGLERIDPADAEAVASLTVS
jgi:predicted nucleic acid-binding protein